MQNLIKYKKKILSIFIKKIPNTYQTKFIGNNHDDMQVCYQIRKKKEIIGYHYTELVKNILIPKKKFLKLLIILKGSVQTNIMSKDKKFKKNFILKDNSMIIIYDCFHKFEFLKNTKLIEVKLGRFKLQRKQLLK
jgi:hypothetical protein